jgi:hypothetical protein
MKAHRVGLPIAAGIAVVAADIVDAAGVHVYGANPPLTRLSGMLSIAQCVGSSDRHDHLL